MYPRTPVSAARVDTTGTIGVTARGGSASDGVLKAPTSTLIGGWSVECLAEYRALSGRVPFGFGCPSTGV